MPTYNPFRTAGDAIGGKKPKGKKKMGRRSKRNPPGSGGLKPRPSRKAPRSRRRKTTRRRRRR